MIKVIAFDLVGVLVHEQDVDLTKEQAALERLFDAFDEPVNELASSLKIENIRQATLDIFNKLYKIEDPDLFNKIRDKYPNISIVIASNHVSHMKEYLEKHFNPDKIYLSSLIGIGKPNPEYFKYILDKENINPEELLFLDDKDGNINSAKSLGINTIKVNSNTNILEEIEYKMI